MLEQLEISRFKSIKAEKLDLGQVNLFIGGNGAGKTSLLEAIGLVSACLGQRSQALRHSGQGLAAHPARVDEVIVQE